ncbi:APC family permease [Clostridium tetani]|uniref:APC family permease n=1 Tax=Clostridium tetani TaxID=1513 RepID=UPI000AC79B84|nr:APC family permease [Clostridium tetani]SUY66793.1 amino acid ABC transporter permease [Clostridium tetani]
MNNNLAKKDIFFIVLGSIVGFGSFMLPGTKFLKDAGVINTALGFILGVLSIIVIEANYRVMMEEHKESGGEFSYVYKNLNETHGFIVGWFLTLAYLTIIPLNATAIPIVAKKLLKGTLEFVHIYNIAGYDVYLSDVILSSLVIVLFAYFNIKGIRKSSKVQNIMISSLVIIVIGIFITMFFKVNKNNIVNNYIYNYEFSISEILTIFSITPFAFIGFDAIPQLSEEFNFSAKKASFLAIISLITGALTYNILNITTALIYSPQEAIKLDWALGSAIETTLGKFGFVLLIIALATAVAGGVNGFMISSTKLVGAIAEYNILPKKLSEPNKKGILKNTILFISLISLIAPWFGRQVISWIVDMSSVGASIAYFYISFIAYKKAKDNRNKIVSIIGTLISVIFILLLLVPLSPAWIGKEALVALIIWIIVGSIVYMRFKSSQNFTTRI